MQPHNITAELLKLNGYLRLVEERYQHQIEIYQELVKNSRFFCDDCRIGSLKGIRRYMDIDKYSVYGVGGADGMVQPFGHCINCILDCSICLGEIRRLELIDSKIIDRIDYIEDTMM